MHGQAGGDGIDVHLLCNEEERKEVREEEGGCSQILCACRNKENQEVCVIVYGNWKGSHHLLGNELMETGRRSRGGFHQHVTMLSGLGNRNSI